MDYWSLHGGSNWNSRLFGGDVALNSLIGKACRLKKVCGYENEKGVIVGAEKIGNKFYYYIYIPKQHSLCEYCKNDFFLTPEEDEWGKRFLGAGKKELKRYYEFWEMVDLESTTCEPSS